MEIKAVLFDLDGTLLPMEQDKFLEVYFDALAKKLETLGYEPANLKENIWAGTVAMVKNRGTFSNEKAFWRFWTDTYGEASLKDKPAIDSFYSNEFEAAKAVCGYNPEAKEIVQILKKQGKTVVLATNPFFPAVATRKRMQWAGLAPEDFALYTTYENSYHCKPNPQYYVDILRELNLQPKECLMVGNDVAEDMIAETLGMKVFLLTDCLINKKEQDISIYPHGGFTELKSYLEFIK